MDKNCAGIYVRESLASVAVIVFRNRKQPIKETRVFNTTEKDILSLIDWLDRLNIKMGAVVGDGGDGWPLTSQTLQARLNFMIIPSNHWANVSSGNSILNEAQWIVELVQSGLLPTSNIPSIKSDVTIKVSDSSGKKVVTTTVPNNVPMKLLLPELVKRLGLPDGSYKALHKRLGKNFSDTDTLFSADVKSDDIVRLLQDVHAGGGIPIRSFRDIQLVEAVLNRQLTQLPGRNSPFYCMFFYTDEDKFLSAYVRDHFQELDKMSGLEGIFFTIEQPASEWKAGIRESLKKTSGDYFSALWTRLGVDNFKPYNKSQAYEIGKRFGVLPNQFPCVLVFKELKSNKIMLIEINEFVDIKAGDLKTEYSKFFRELFSVMGKVAVDESKDNQLDRVKKLLSTWRKSQRKMRNTDPKLLELGAPLAEIVGAIISLLIK